MYISIYNFKYVHSILPEKLPTAVIPLIPLFVTKSHYVAQIDLKLALWPRLALNL